MNRSAVGIGLRLCAVICFVTEGLSLVLLRGPPEVFERALGNEFDVAVNEGHIAAVAVEFSRGE